MNTIHTLTIKSDLWTKDMQGWKEEWTSNQTDAENETQIFLFTKLWIDKTRSIEKTSIWVSVRWKTKTKTKGSTRLAYTGLLGGLEHLKIEMRLIVEKFASVMGEYVFVKL